MEHWKEYFTDIEIEILKKTNNLYDKAYYIVRRIFLNKKDKGGNPYLSHLLYVSNNVPGRNAKVVGLLHDIIEDTIITSEDLLLINFPENIVDSVLIVTRKNDESYDEFIERIIKSKNKVALMVKKVDIENNMDLSRIENVSKKDIDRVEIKYKPNYKKILEVIRKD